MGKLALVHVGEVLMEDFIKGFEITQNKLAVAIDVPPRRINEIVHGKRGIPVDTGDSTRSLLRNVGRLLGESPDSLRT